MYYTFPDVVHTISRSNKTSQGKLIRLNTFLDSNRDYFRSCILLRCGVKNILQTDWAFMATRVEYQIGLIFYRMTGVWRLKASKLYDFRDNK